jgi:hypothetical protein
LLSSNDKSKPIYENNYIVSHKTTNSTDSNNRTSKTANLVKPKKQKEIVFEVLNTEFVNEFHSKIKDSDKKKKHEGEAGSPLKTDTNIQPDNDNYNCSYNPINTEPVKNTKNENPNMLKLNIDRPGTGSSANSNNYGNYANFNIRKNLKDQYEKFIKKNSKTPSIDTSKEPVMDKKEKDKLKKPAQFTNNFFNTSMSFDQNADSKNTTFESITSPLIKGEIKKKL